MGGELLTGNTRGKEYSGENQLTVSLLKTGLGGMVEDEEIN